MRRTLVTRHEHRGAPYHHNYRLVYALLRIRLCVWCTSGIGHARAHLRCVKGCVLGGRKKKGGCSHAEVLELAIIGNFEVAVRTFPHTDIYIKWFGPWKEYSHPHRSFCALRISSSGAKNSETHLLC